MKAKWLILAVVALGLLVAHSVGFAAAPTILPTQSTAFNAAIATSINGELGLYLVGPWDSRTRSLYPQGELVSTLVQLVNPVSTNKWAFMTFWGWDETPLSCTPSQVTANGQTEAGFFGSNNGYFFGAVKVLVTNDNGNPDLGLVGYRREIHDYRNCAYGGTSACDFFTGSASISEIRLQPIPPKVLFSDRTPQDAVPDEVKNIACLCGVDGGNFGACP